METKCHDELLASDFLGLSFEKLGDIHCFQAGGVELREKRLTAIKPPRSDSTDSHFVLYLGRWHKSPMSTALSVNSVPLCFKKKGLSDRPRIKLESIQSSVESHTIALHKLQDQPLWEQSLYAE